MTHSDLTALLDRARAELMAVERHQKDLMPAAGKSVLTYVLANLLKAVEALAERVKALEEKE